MSATENMVVTREWYENAVKSMKMLEIIMAMTSDQQYDSGYRQVVESVRKMLGGMYAEENKGEGAEE